MDSADTQHVEYYELSVGRGEEEVSHKSLRRRKKIKEGGKVDVAKLRH